MSYIYIYIYILTVFNRYYNYLFIKYELDEFELNVYGWYDVVSMLVNNIK